MVEEKFPSAASGFATCFVKLKQRKSYFERGIVACARVACDKIARDNVACYQGVCDEKEGASCK